MLVDFLSQPQIGFPQRCRALSDQLLQTGFMPLAINRVPNRTVEKLTGQLRFNQVVLSAMLDGCRDQFLVVQRAQDHDCRLRSFTANQFKRLAARAIRESQVQQNCLDRCLFQLPQAIAEPIGNA
jgi:hypothetical protein